MLTPNKLISHSDHSWERNDLKDKSHQGIKYACRQKDALSGPSTRS